MLSVLITTFYIHVVVFNVCELWRSKHFTMVEKPTMSTVENVFIKSIFVVIVSKHILEKQAIGNNVVKLYSACSVSSMWENRGEISAQISEGEEQIGCCLMANTFSRLVRQIPSRCHEPKFDILTLSARGPSLDVRIWHLQTSNSDV